MTLIGYRRQTPPQPLTAVQPVGRIVVPKYFWTPAYTRLLSGRQGVIATTHDGIYMPTIAGVGFDSVSSTKDIDWTISESSSTFPAILAGVFVCGTTTGPTTAVGIGDSAAGSGCYGFVGVYNTNSIGGAMRPASGGDDTAIDGPAAVVGKQYNCLYISRSVSDHSLYVNGIRYSNTNSNATPSGAWGRFDIACVSRGGTKIFRGPHRTLMGWFDQGYDPGDGWCRTWTLFPELILQPPPIQPWFGVTAAGGTFIPIIGRGPGLALAGRSGLAG